MFPSTSSTFSQPCANNISQVHTCGLYDTENKTSTADASSEFACQRFASCCWKVLRSAVLIDYLQYTPRRKFHAISSHNFFRILSEFRNQNDIRPLNVVPSLSITMKRSISPVSVMEHQRPLDAPRRKRPKTADPCLDDAKDDDIANLLLSLSSKKSSVESNENASQQNRVKEEDDDANMKERVQALHRVVSDDEDDNGHTQSAAAKKKAKPAQPTDWRSFSRPIGPPPRLPMVPAGFVFPARAHTLK